MDLGLEGVLKMCEKHLGTRITKALLVLVVITMVCVCLAVISKSFIYPIYNFIEYLIENRTAIKITPIRLIPLVVSSLLLAVTMWIVSTITYIFIIKPADEKFVKEFRKKCQDSLEELKEQGGQIIKKWLDSERKCFELLKYYNAHCSKIGVEPIEIPDHLNKEFKPPSSTPDTSTSPN